MKTKLSIEESSRLIELGVDPKLASEDKVTYDKNDKPYLHPVFGFTDLLSILPKEIKEDDAAFNLNIDFPLPDQVAARYIDPDNVDNDILGVMCDELIDCIYHLLIRVIRNGHLKTEKK